MVGRLLLQSMKFLLGIRNFPGVVTFNSGDPETDVVLDGFIYSSDQGKIHFRLTKTSLRGDLEFSPIDIPPAVQVALLGYLRQ